MFTVTLECLLSSKGSFKSARSFMFASPTYVHVHVHVCSTCQRFVNEQNLSHHKSLAPVQYNYYTSEVDYIYPTCVEAVYEVFWSDKMFIL